MTTDAEKIQGLTILSIGLGILSFALWQNWQSEKKKNKNIFNMVNDGTLKYNPK